MMTSLPSLAARLKILAPRIVTGPAEGPTESAVVKLVSTSALEEPTTVEPVPFRSLTGAARVPADMTESPMRVKSLRVVKTPALLPERKLRAPVVLVPAVIPTIVPLDRFGGKYEGEETGTGCAGALY